jgi:hypothetical protein
LSAALLCAGSAGAEYHGPESIEIPLNKHDAGTLALDGDFVHNVGELHLNITNWGLIGSRPGSSTNYSEAPSAMWPAGSGIEYLWAAGVWIGAIRNGVPLVTTGQFTPELMALPEDPLDTVWATRKGMTGGERYPSPTFDDDGDGEEDEDPLNGLDDDGDGLVDEDFAAVGNQGFSVSMRDNISLLTELWPDHEPLGIRLQQSTYQWEGDDFDDFVGFDFVLSNIGTNALNDLYFGFFADCDVGPREYGSVAIDDLPGYFEGRVRADDGSWVPLTIAYMYDADGDGGRSPGFFGITYLNHPTDHSGGPAPMLVGASAFHAFAGARSYDRGGDPTNDFERYELLASASIDSVPGLYATDFANDYRILVSAGPFEVLEPAASMSFAAAMVVGPGLWGLLQHAADAGLTYYGAWFNRDGNFESGVGGTEKYICATDFGSPAGDPLNPIYKMFISPCDTIGGGITKPINIKWLDKDGCIWVNSDCRFERERGVFTGVGGREHWVPWLVETAPVAPNMRIWEADNRTHLFWNNMSELVRDELTQLPDFESYRIWRADGWERPFGTSIENGPPSSLWRLVAEFDLVNEYEQRRVVDNEQIVEYVPLGANTGLEMVGYTPLMLREGTREYDETAEARDLVRRILEDPRFEFLGPTMDPAEFMRYTTSSGRLTPVGDRYPEIARYSNSWDVIDTAYWEQTGVEFYEYVDENVFNGFAYFYAVTATDHQTRSGGSVITGYGIESDPQGNFGFATPRFAPQTAEERDIEGQDVFVFPNPATPASLSEFSQFNANADDPTGIRVMFANLPASLNTISIYTLAGDLVEVIEHDGTTSDCPQGGGFGNCGGAAYWNLVSRQGQEIVSGIYLYAVESSDSSFDPVIGRFVVVR